MQLTINFGNQTYRTRTLAIFPSYQDVKLEKVVIAASRLRDGQSGNIFLELDTANAALGELHKSDCGKYCTLVDPQNTNPDSSWTVTTKDGQQVLIPTPEDTPDESLGDAAAVTFINGSDENACVTVGFGDLPAMDAKALQPKDSVGIPVPNAFTLALMDDALPGDVVYPSLIMQSRNITLETTVAYKVLARQEGEELELFVSKA